MLTLKAIDFTPLLALPAKAKSFGGLFLTHLRTHYVAYLAIWLSATLIGANYTVGFNQSASLPQDVFVIHKHEPAAKGDYIAFLVPPPSVKALQEP